MRRWTTDRWTALAARCGNGEEGITLILVVIVMFALSIMLVTVISYSSSSSTSTYQGDAKNRATNLAEAGLNEAYSLISQTGTDINAIKPPPPDVNSTLISGPNGGYTRWGGVYTSSTKTWTITSIGYYPSPTGSGTVTKAMYASVQIVAPPYTFASLNNSCDKHTLIITLGGQLTVTNGIYVNSCDNGHDAFDVKGVGGVIAAPTIQVVGGWERANGDLVKVNGVSCPLLNDNPPDPSPPAGCPSIGQPVISDPYASKLTAPTLGSPACTYNVYGAPVSYPAPKQKLVGNITAAQTTLTTDQLMVVNGDVIQIDTEQMLVTAGGGTTALTVSRAFNGTTAATHNNGKEIKKLPLTGVAGTAALPAPCVIRSGTVTLNPGTYYGGICIGGPASNECGGKIGGSCATNSGGTANVTLNPGTYIMAGGGFFACGSSTLSAPNVMIYNTQDPTNTAGSGAFEQLQIDTTGSVVLGPQSTGAYQGLTYFQDRTLAVAPAKDCDTKKDTPTDQDFVLTSMASSGANGALGSISGTIYAAAARADFGTAVGGVGNIAVLTGCLVIAGGDATFDFHPEGLFGTGDSMKVVKQW
jgi:Tfp pilus assembly protein PilX